MPTALQRNPKALKHHIESQISELAAMVKKGFDSIEEKLDVRQKVETLEREMKELRESLHL